MNNIIPPLPWAEFCESDDWWINSVDSEGTLIEGGFVINSNADEVSNQATVEYIIKAANAYPKLITTLRELWHLALIQPEFTGFCDEVVVRSRNAINAVLAGGDGREGA